jgi:hypothetical protein
MLSNKQPPKGVWVSVSICSIIMSELYTEQDRGVRVRDAQNKVWGSEVEVETARN